MLEVTAALGSSQTQMTKQLSLPNGMPTHGAAPLLASWRRSAGGKRNGVSSGTHCSRSGGASYWVGYAVLAAAVLAWLAMMDAGGRNGDGAPGGAVAVRWSDSSASQLRELGRLPLERCLFFPIYFFWETALMRPRLCCKTESCKPEHHP